MIVKSDNEITVINVQLKPINRRKEYDSKSLPNKRWYIFPQEKELAAQIGAITKASPLISQLLVNRGITTVSEAKNFLDTEHLVLPSPLQEFKDLEVSVKLLRDAIANQSKIAICGDYDADGMTSTALLLRVLRILGAKVDYAIPSRMREGYGINKRIVEEFYSEGVEIILTVDNGISALEPIARARELGLKVIVTDHHDIPPELPQANAILNPKLVDESSPYRGIAGVGVAYILGISLAQELDKITGLVRPMLELFTLGTIADLAPLTGVNRRWVKRGLKHLPKSTLPGIQALMQVGGVQPQAENNKSLRPEDIGFRLGPRINAIGRIGDPQIVIDLLTTDDMGIALERAMQCEQINKYRQELCEEIEKAAISYVEAELVSSLRDNKALVLVQPDWHHGVIGIVASRLVERYGVPVFIGTYEEGDKIRGSARGIPEFNVFEALQYSQDLLSNFGGHRAAGGFSLASANLGLWQRRLWEFANQCLSPQHLKPLLKIDAEVNLNQINLEFYQQLNLLHPCGIDNPDPVFWASNVQVIEQVVIAKTHLKLKLLQTIHHQQFTIKAIAWRWHEYFPLPPLVDIAYKLRQNYFRGNTTIELELVGVRYPLSS